MSDDGSVVGRIWAGCGVLASGKYASLHFEGAMSWRQTFPTRKPRQRTFCASRSQSSYSVRSTGDPGRFEVRRWSFVERVIVFDLEQLQCGLYRSRF